MDHDPAVKKRIEIASNYLFGSGIEIGALHRPLPINEISNICEIKYVDRMDVVELRKHYPELESYNLVQVDIIDDGETLSKIDSNSLDYIICNHMLEHCENPIRTIANFVTKLKKNGTIFLTVPDKRFCFDKDRELTTFNHCMDDDHLGPEISRYNHYIEWAKLVNGIKDETEITNQANRLLEMNYSIHFHVWDESTFSEFIIKTKKYLGNVFTIEKIELSFGEIICVLKNV